MFIGSYSAINLYTETEADLKFKEEMFLSSKRTKEIFDLKEKLKSESLLIGQIYDAYHRE